MEREEGLLEDGIYADYFTVTGTDADMRGRWKMSSVFRCIQNISSDHCDICGSGRDVLMEKYGLCYVIIRSHVKFDRIPVCGEIIRAETWPDNRLRLIFDRFYRFYDEKSEKIGSARTRWVLMDYAKRSAVKPEPEMMHFKDTSAIEPAFVMPPLDWLEEKFRGTDAPETLDVTRKPVYGDYDYNRHVNNTKYVDWAVDAIYGLRADPLVTEIDMQYQNEIPIDRLGESYALACKMRDDGAFSVECSDSGNRRIFLCKGITV